MALETTKYKRLSVRQPFYQLLRVMVESAPFGGILKGFILFLREPIHASLRSASPKQRTKLSIKSIFFPPFQV